LKTLRDTTTERIRELRQQRGMSQQGLVDRMRLLGSRLDRTAIAKIEKGTRDLTLLEAFQFAYALDVAPVHLFVPTDPDPDEEIALGPNVTAPPAELRAWIRGFAPLLQDARLYFTHVPKDEFDAAHADAWERAAGIVVKTSPDE
jgi:transcriptional regulator with XRE-family HTH domain